MKDFLQGIFENNLLTASRLAEISEGSDAAAGAGTGAEISVGDTFAGTISSATDRDWVAVDLVAGQSYVFTVWGVGGSNTGITDTELTLRGPTGSAIETNDDIAAQFRNYFSLIEYTATTSGTFYLDVGAFEGNDTGDYILQAATNVYTIDQAASYISEVDWGSPAPIRFDVGPGGTITVNLGGLNANGKQLAEWALEAWSIATGITFTEVAAGGDIVFDDNSSGAFAGPSLYNPVDGLNTRSDVNVGASWLTQYGTTIDSYSFQTYLHEIGHALGLGHAGPYDGAATYGDDNIYLNDSVQLTVMSYFDPIDNDFISGSDVIIVTPQMADLVAIHSMYGTPEAYEGNTTWGTNSNVGGWLGELFAIAFDGASPDSSFYADGPLGLTIFDTGGIDTLDLSPITQNQRIDLRPETLSDVGGDQNNVAIARDTIIENVVGGSGGDDIRGNTADNTITPGAGNDTVNGGAGSDTVVLNVASSSITATAEGASIRIVSAEGTDIFSNVENFAFTDGTLSASEVLGEDTTGGVDPVDGLQVGGTGPDTLLGGDGADSIFGQDGDDVIDGGAGADEIAGADGNDTIDGGGGNDNIGGGLGDDVIEGEGGNDTIGAGQGNDSANGGAGEDGVFGGAGDDTLLGGDDNDVMGAGFNNDSVEGGNGDDDMGGGTGRDTVNGGAGNDTIGAGEGDDTVSGGAGDDFLAGGGRNDLIFGNGGADRINGGNGDDTMTGGAGADQFLFNTFNDGEIDTITDFEDGIDLIRLTGVENAPGTGLQGKVDALNPTNTSAGVTLEYNGHTILLEGVSASEIGTGDFIFV